MSSGELVPQDNHPHDEGELDEGNLHPLALLFEAFHIVRSHHEREYDRTFEDEQRRQLTQEENNEREAVFDRARELLELSDEEGNRLVVDTIARAHFETLQGVYSALSFMGEEGGQLNQETVVKNPTAFAITAIDERTGKRLRFVIRRIPEAQALEGREAPKDDVVDEKEDK